MDKDKIERIEGTTRYVKIGATVYDTIGKDSTPKKVICECLFCGERFGGDANGNCPVYCKTCRTKEGREKIKAENDKLKLEQNVKKNG